MNHYPHQEKKKQTESRTRDNFHTQTTWCGGTELFCVKIMKIINSAKPRVVPSQACSLYDRAAPVCSHMCWPTPAGKAHRDENVSCAQTTTGHYFPSNLILLIEQDVTSEMSEAREKIPLFVAPRQAAPRRNHTSSAQVVVESADSHGKCRLPANIG